jgi:hypothetical protein
VGLFSRNTDSDGDSDGEKNSFLEERGFIASAIVVGSVLICLVVWFMLGGRSDNPTANPSQTPSTSAPTGQPTQEESTGPPPASPTEVPSATQTTPPPPPNSHTGGCHDKNPSQAIPRVAAPVAVSWQFEGKMLVPIQAASGPASTSANGVRSCFAHSPTGAVLAAMVLLGQIQNPEVSIAALRSRVYPGPGRDAAIAAAGQTARTPSSAEPGDIQFAGFKVLDYPPNATRTILQVVADLNGKAYGAMPVTMRWYKSDWYVELQPDGSFNGSVEPDILTSLSGYVRFSGAA